MITPRVPPDVIFLFSFLSFFLFTFPLFFLFSLFSFFLFSPSFFFSSFFFTFLDACNRKRNYFREIFEERTCESIPSSFPHKYRRFRIAVETLEHLAFFHDSLSLPLSIHPFVPKAHSTLLNMLCEDTWRIKTRYIIGVVSSLPRFVFAPVSTKRNPLRVCITLQRNFFLFLIALDLDVRHLRPRRSRFEVPSLYRFYNYLSLSSLSQRNFFV